MSRIEEQEITWTTGHLSIRIRITFDNSLGIVEHLTIQSIEPENAPLPITSTGYKSYFVSPGTVAAYGGPVAATLSLLNEAAASTEWRQHLSVSRQSSLF